MHVIENLDEYKQILKEFKSEKVQITTNCYLLPRELQEYISEGNISVHTEPGFIIVFQEKPDYISVYYYLKDEIREIGLLGKGSKPLVADIPVKLPPEKIGEKPDCHAVEAIGLEYSTMHIRMTRNLDDIPCTQMPDEYRFETLDSLKSEICNLWRRNIDPMTTIIPSEERMVRQGERLYAIYDRNGKLCSAMMVILSGKTAVFEHVATAAEQQGRGLARMMLSLVMSDLAGMGVRHIRLWVDCKNIPALHLYERSGFEYDGLASLQYTSG